MLGYIISDKDEIRVRNHKIKSFDILHKTNLNIFVIENNKVLYKNDIIINACKYGHIQVLEWLKNSGYEFKYDENAIMNASAKGHIQVLEWFKNSGYEFKHNKYAIYFATKNEHIKVLEWFKNSGYEFKYVRWTFYKSEIKILKFYSFHINMKKIIKWITWPKSEFFIKTIKFKTNNKYLKGYQKN
jgi:hypothetical protein